MATVTAERNPGAAPQSDTSERENAHEQQPAQPIGAPQGEKTLAEVRAEAQRIRDANRQERIELSRTQLETKRSRLAEISARLTGRIFTRKNGSAQALYEAHLASYNETLHELGQLEHPELHEEPSTLDESERNRIAIQFLFKEQAQLRAETQQNMEGTRLAKVVNWMNSGGRLKVFMKYAAVGVVFGGLAAVTGGAAAGVGIGMGVSAAGRFGRGFIRSEAERGTDIDSVEEATGGEQAFAQQIDENRGHKENLIQAGSRILGQLFRERDIKEKQRGRRKSVRNGLFMTALGYGISKVIGAGMAVARADAPVEGRGIVGRGATPGSPAHGQLANQEGMYETKPTPGSAADFRMAEEQSVADFDKWIELYVYHHEQNPFYSPDKIGQYDMGPPLHPDETLADLTRNRWLDSPEQFASICTAFGIDNLPDDTGTINALAEQLKIDPIAYMDKYQAVMSIMDADTTTVETGIPIQSSAIESEFLADPNGTGNPERAWQEYVQNQEKGTKTVITFQNPITHQWCTIELREQCGGQRMVERPEPVYVAPEVPYTPQGGGYYESAPSYYAPQGGGSPEYVPEQQQPQGGGEPHNPGNPVIPGTPGGGGNPPVPAPENKGSNYLADAFTQLLGRGENRAPAQVAPQEQTYNGGRDTGGGGRAPAIIDNSQHNPGHEIGTGAPNADRGSGLSPGGESAGRAQNPGVGPASNVDTGPPS